MTFFRRAEAELSLPDSGFPPNGPRDGRAFTPVSGFSRSSARQTVSRVATIPGKRRYFDTTEKRGDIAATPILEVRGESSSTFLRLTGGERERGGPEAAIPIGKCNLAVHSFSA